MRSVSSWRPPSRVAVIGVTLAMAAAGGFASPALAGPAAAAKRVSATPANGTPQLVLSSGHETGNIRQLVKCGKRMYAVGKFTSIRQGGSTFARNNVFSFNAAAPYSVSSWSPNVNGTVNTIAFAGGHCSNAYIGGQFTQVGGTSVKNLAKISTSTGAVNASFGHNASGQVETLLGYRNHLLEGGDFTSTNDNGRAYYASLNPATGEDDGFVTLRVSGNIPPGPTKVYNQQLSHNGKLLLVEGDFTSVGGLPRQQIFMLNLSGSTAKVTGWTSTEFTQPCILRESFYLRSAAWSPNDATIYTASTGDHARDRKSGSFPLTGLCDSTAAFPAAQKAVHHDWIEYAGCDSYYSVAADASDVYVAGHIRWGDNQNGCNNAGPGAVPDKGLQGLSPGTGKVELNSRGKALYNMSRANADDMLVTGAGLWIASSNRFGSNMCGRVSGHTGICLLPYR
jgi:hypothetical protein